MNFFPQPCAAPSESARLGAKQGQPKSAKAATNNHFPSLTSSQNQTSNIKNQKSFPLRPWRLKARLGNAGRESSVPQSPIANRPFRPLRPLRPWREQSAFSLTEVVIAMGVAAVAFTSIIALFPLGLNMSKDSYEETQSALIAQTILADVKDQQTGGSNLRYLSPDNPYSYKLIQITGGVDPTFTPTNYLGISLASTNTQNVYLAYDSQKRTDTDPTSQPIMLRPSAYATNPIPGWYDGTSPSNGLAAVVKVTFVPTFSITSVSNTTGLLRVDISIETPGSAMPKNRTVRTYTGAVVP